MQSNSQSMSLVRANEPKSESHETFCEADVRATRRFLGHEGRGVTEVRVISPGYGITGIGYFDNEDAFVRACAQANGTANVYIGIQPRPARFLEHAPNRMVPLRSGAHDKDIEVVTAIVLDLDPVRPKDTASTEAELGLAVTEATALAESLVAKQLNRPVRVMSGNGCHLWLAIHPIEVNDSNRAEITARFKDFEARLRQRVTCEAVKLDSIYNLSRIIKVVGTLSVKGEHSDERPHRLSCPLDRFERREDARLRHAILTLQARPVRQPEPASDEQNAVSPKQELSPAVRALLLSSPRIRAAFEGRGKTALGENGRPLDTSSSGYDFSLAMALATKGVTDPAELANALWHRPDGAAQAKGKGYIARTVRSALALLATTKAASVQKSGAVDAVDFTVTRTVVFDSDPKVYHLHIDGQVLVLSSDELANPHRFKRKFMDALRRIPRLPHGKQIGPTYEDTVNEWLATAQIIHQPPEASRRGLQQDELQVIIDGMGEADTADDLERGRALRIDGRRAFKTRTLAKAARESLVGDIGTHELCDLLRDMGCTNKTAWLDGRAQRVWLAPDVWPNAPTPSPTTRSGGDAEVTAAT